MDFNTQIKKLEEEIKEYFHTENSGHDIYHLKRVMNLALHIQKKEGGDRNVIGIAALLHDIHRIMQVDLGRYCPPIESLATIKDIIDRADIELSQKQLEMVLHCIEHHEEYNFSKKGKTVNDIETLILQDADNLDAMGAIGTARTFTYSGAYNVPMWVVDIPLGSDTHEEGMTDTSIIHHFYNKLLKLKDNMNTKTGKYFADKRHKFMEDFLEEFFAEWEGDR